MAYIYTSYTIREREDGTISYTICDNGDFPDVTDIIILCDGKEESRITISDECLEAFIEVLGKRLAASKTAKPQ